MVDTDAEAIAMARAYLDYFPSNRNEPPPVVFDGDVGPRLVPELLDIIPPNARKPYDVREVIRAIADDNEYFEVQPLYGQSLSIGWAHLGSRVVGFVANNPRYRAGALDSPAAIKATDFIELAETYGHPVVFLLDNPGVMEIGRAHV